MQLGIMIHWGILGTCLFPSEFDCLNPQTQLTLLGKMVLDLDPVGNPLPLSSFGYVRMDDANVSCLFHTDIVV